MAQFWLNASWPSSMAPNSAPTGTSSPSLMRVLVLHQNCIMIFRAVRSRCRAEETTTSDFTSAGLNG